MRSTINELFEASVATNGKRIALRMLIPKERKNRRGIKLLLNEISYQRLGEMAGRFTNALSEMGVEKGNKVAIVSKPRATWASAFFGILGAGAVVVPLDPDLKQGEISTILSESEAKVVVMSGEKASDLNSIREERLPELTLICMDQLQDTDIRFFDALLIDRSPQSPMKLDPKEMAILMYTSGTTGNAKGAMLSHGNVAGNTLAAREVVELSPRDNFLSIVPWYHIYGLSITLVCPIITGSTTSYAPVDRNLPLVLRTAKPTIVLGVPKLFNVLYGRITTAISDSLIKSTIYRLSPLLMGKLVTRKMFGSGFRFFTSGGAPLIPEVRHGFAQMGIGIMEGYGLTETSPVLTMSEESSTEPGMKPFPEVEIKIADPDENGVGEVLAQGPNIMAGYYKNQSATDEVIDSDGWFHTGDLGQLDEQGKLTLSGRAKNVIVLETGKNVYPEEIEWQLSTIPVVEEIMVYEGERQGAAAVSAMIFPDWAELEKQGISEPDEALTCIWKAIKQRDENLAPFKRIRNKDSISLVDEQFEKSVKLDIKRYKYK